MKRAFLILVLALLLLAALCLAARAEQLDLPADTRVIEAEAFRNCTSLTGALVIPDGVVQIGASAFAGCDGFTGVPVIPGSVRSIGAHAFDGCAGLSGTLYLANGVEVDDTAFDNCPNLTVVRSDFFPMRVALIVDGSVEDGAMNEACYSAISAYCDAKGFAFAVLENGDGAVDRAIEAGSNVVVMPGFAFAETIAQAQRDYPDVRFIGLDISEDDLEADIEGNTFLATYREEQAGFLAGYAAVKLGYRHLGFLGGVAVPSVNRYGYGFAQGADAAATELGIEDETIVEFAYAGTFAPNAEITEHMRKWYDAMGVEVVFACGGGIWGSVGGATAECGRGKLIGVDTDQAAEIDGIFGEGTTVTSAVKGLGETARMALEAIEDGNWEALGGTSQRLGIVGADLALNHVGLAASTRFGSGFTRDDYQALVAGLYSGDYAVSEDLPDTQITVRTVDPTCVAVITDEGGVEDGGFNQAVYEGALASDLPLRAYALGDEQEGADLVAQAAASGFDVMILPGFAFAETIAQAQRDYPDVKFIGLDISEEDLGADIEGNTFLATYKEEQAGFLAGYAAVKLGYRHLGFLGGMDIPAVNRYGYGFVQGTDAAATELSIAGDVDVVFSYADAFWPSDELTERMRTWYSEGVEVVFACGGGIWQSVTDAASDFEGAMVIGVDVDQAADIGQARTLTSAMKRLEATTLAALSAIDSGNWEALGGTAQRLGVVGADPASNHVGLAPSTQFAEDFTAENYAALTLAIYSGDYAISDSTDEMPETAIQVYTME